MLRVARESFFKFQYIPVHKDTKSQYIQVHNIISGLEHDLENILNFTFLEYQEKQKTFAIAFCSTLLPPLVRLYWFFAYVTQILLANF